MGFYPTIGPLLWGFINISSQTLNLVDCFEGRIEVKKNICGFHTAAIEIKDRNQNVLISRFFKHYEHYSEVKKNICGFRTAAIEIKVGIKMFLLDLRMCLN